MANTHPEGPTSASTSQPEPPTDEPHHGAQHKISYGTWYWAVSAAGLACTVSQAPYWLARLRCLGQLRNTGADGESSAAGGRSLPAPSGLVFNKSDSKHVCGFAGCCPVWIIGAALLFVGYHSAETESDRHDLRGFAWGWIPKDVGLVVGEKFSGVRQGCLDGRNRRNEAGRNVLCAGRNKKRPKAYPWIGCDFEASPLGLHSLPTETKKQAAPGQRGDG